MKYVLLFVETEEFAGDLEAMGPAERDRAYQRVAEWMATHADKIRGGNKLQPAETATTVRLGAGEPVITDGPFVEGKEVVSGYTEIEYDMLLHLAPSPVARLHRAIAVRYTAGAQAAMAELDDLAGLLSEYHLYHASRAELLRELGQPDQARAADRRALELTANPAEQALLHHRLTAWV